MENHQFDLVDQQGEQPLEYRARGTLGALQREEDPPDDPARTGGRRYDDHRLVGMLEQGPCGVPGRIGPRRGSTGPGSDGGDDHLGVTQRIDQRGLQRALDDTERDLGPGGRGLSYASSNLAPSAGSAIQVARRSTIRWPLAVTSQSRAATAIAVPRCPVVTPDRWPRCSDTNASALAGGRTGLPGRSCDSGPSARRAMACGDATETNRRERMVVLGVDTANEEYRRRLGARLLP